MYIYIYIYLPLWLFLYPSWRSHCRPPCPSREANSAAIPSQTLALALVAQAWLQPNVCICLQCLVALNRAAHTSHYITSHTITYNPCLPSPCQPRGRPHSVLWTSSAVVRALAFGSSLGLELCYSTPVGQALVHSSRLMSPTASSSWPQPCALLSRRARSLARLYACLPACLVLAELTGSGLALCALLWPQASQALIALAAVKKVSRQKNGHGADLALGLALASWVLLLLTARSGGREGRRR